MLTTRADLGAAADGVPGGIGPLDVGAITQNSSQYSHKVTTWKPRAL